VLFKVARIFKNQKGPLKSMAKNNWHRFKNLQAKLPVLSIGEGYFQEKLSHLRVQKLKVLRPV
jgi:hypothetical protein